MTDEDTSSQIALPAWGSDLSSKPFCHAQVLLQNLVTIETKAGLQRSGCKNVGECCHLLGRYPPAAVSVLM